MASTKQEIRSIIDDIIGEYGASVPYDDLVSTVISSHGLGDKRQEVVGVIKDMVTEGSVYYLVQPGSKPVIRKTATPPNEADCFREVGEALKKERIAQIDQRENTHNILPDLLIQMKDLINRSELSAEQKDRVDIICSLTNDILLNGQPSKGRAL